MESDRFYGFPRETIKFLAGLNENNSREWFIENKEVYETSYKKVGLQFSAALADKLTEISGKKNTFKIYRLHRDLRFSKDKTPYNTHLRVSVFPNGNGKFGPAWHFSLEPDKFRVGAGTMRFDKSTIASFRRRLDGTSGQILDAIIVQLLSDGFYMNEPELKRIPAPHCESHIYGHYLRRKSLTLWRDFRDPYGLCTKRGLPNLIHSYLHLIPLMEWLERSAYD